MKFIEVILLIIIIMMVSSYVYYIVHPYETRVSKENIEINQKEYAEDKCFPYIVQHYFVKSDGSVVAVCSSSDGGMEIK